jgi:dTDP-4-dehydrorhamnose 3,5-epimerase-like enzyme
MLTIEKKSVFFVELLVNHIYQRHFVTVDHDFDVNLINGKIIDYFMDLHKDEPFFDGVEILKVSREAKEVISL